jgi:hypothetical protein
VRTSMTFPAGTRVIVAADVSGLEPVSEEPQAESPRVESTPIASTIRRIFRPSRVSRKSLFDADCDPCRHRWVLLRLRHFQCDHARALLCGGHKSRCLDRAGS